jgi:hypothetical protein
MANPSSIINLANWKLTLPTGKKGSPAEITQPKLDTYSGAHFYVDGANVIFTAPTNGVTTSGSLYPRSELREMKAGGKKLAAWSNKRTTRTLDVAATFLELPSGKREVVACQIHGGSDDITKLILRGSTLSITIGDNGNEDIGAYTLGTPFTFRYKARPGGIECWYNGALVHTIPGNFSGAYFKAGCYTQANKSNGSGKGQVAISSLTLDGAAPLAPPPVVVEDTPRPPEPEPPPPENPCGG